MNVACTSDGCAVRPGSVFTKKEEYVCGRNWTKPADTMEADNDTARQKRLCVFHRYQGSGQSLFPLACVLNVFDTF